MLLLFDSIRLTDIRNQFDEVLKQSMKLYITGLALILLC